MASIAAERLTLFRAAIVSIRSAVASVMDQATLRFGPPGPAGLPAPGRAPPRPLVFFFATCSDSKQKEGGPGRQDKRGQEGRKQSRYVESVHR